MHTETYRVIEFYFQFLISVFWGIDSPDRHHLTPLPSPSPPPIPQGMSASDTDAYLKPVFLKSAGRFTSIVFITGPTGEPCLVYQFQGS